MSQLKVKHHYVWQHYLRAWSDTKNIWSYFKEQSIVKLTPIKSIAQVKHLYKIPDITEKDMGYMLSFFNYLNMNQEMIQLVIGNINQLRTINELLKKVKEKGIQEEIPPIISISINHLSNTIEEIHSNFERLGFYLLTVKELNDLEKFNNPVLIENAITFLCYQYLRTNKYFLLFSSSIKKNNWEINPDIWHLIVLFALAPIISAKMMDGNGMRIVLLKNSNSVGFLTSDQPVINLRGDELDEYGFPKSLELYYPLSPSHALTISFNQVQSKKFSSEDITEDKIKYLNSKVVENAGGYVFSNNKEQLMSLVNLYSILQQ